MSIDAFCTQQWSNLFIQFMKWVFSVDLVAEKSQWASYQKRVTRNYAYGQHFKYYHESCEINSENCKKIISVDVSDAQKKAWEFYKFRKVKEILPLEITKWAKDSQNEEDEKIKDIVLRGLANATSSHTWKKQENNCTLWRIEFVGYSLGNDDENFRNQEKENSVKEKAAFINFTNYLNAQFGEGACKLLAYWGQHFQGSAQGDPPFMNMRRIHLEFNVDLMMNKAVSNAPSSSVLSAISTSAQSQTAPSSSASTAQPQPQATPKEGDEKRFDM